MLNKYLPIVARGAVVGLILCAIFALLVTGVFYSAYFGFIDIFSGASLLLLLRVFLLIVSIALIIVIVGIIKLIAECEEFQTMLENYITKGEL